MCNYGSDGTPYMIGFSWELTWNLEPGRVILDNILLHWLPRACVSGQVDCWLDFLEQEVLIAW